MKTVYEFSKHTFWSFLIGACLTLLIAFNLPNQIEKPAEGATNNIGRNPQVSAPYINSLAPQIGQTAKDAAGFDKPLFPKKQIRDDGVDTRNKNVKLINNYESAIEYYQIENGENLSENIQLANLPPAYIWWYGCSPTAGGMIVAWWDAQGDGFSNIWEGSAATWSGNGSSGTKRMVASQAHIDSGAALGFTYGSYRNHTANSIADFYYTEDGGTARSSIGPGFEDYFAWDDPSTTLTNESYTASYQTRYVSSGYTYDDYKAEIDAGRPVHLGLTSTEGGHSVVGVGYDDSAGKTNFILYNTWDSSLHSWQWSDETYSGYNFDVYAGTMIQVESQDPGYNVAPVLASIGNKNVNENSALTFQVAATDVNFGDTLTYSVTNLPSGAIFTPATRTFTWTPGYDQAGSFVNVHFEVSDGELTDTEDITITVNNVNRPPVFDVIGNKSVNENEVLLFTVLATDPDGDSVNYGVNNLPSGASFTAGTRTFAWTPNYLQSGTYNVGFAAGDGTVQSVSNITITVANVPQEPFPNDTAAISTKTYSAELAIAGQKTSDCSAYIGNNLIADFNTTSWSYTLNLNLGASSYDVIYKNYLGTEISRKTIYIIKNRLADINGDNSIDLLDLSILANFWGVVSPGESLTDINGDGIVDLMDLSIFANNWGG